ncbi:MAG: sodium:calcium antiporter [Actinomycetota bacterium]|jgi:cation:H+ antiporter|nr:sodium:calcium antiporter [Actinomycetota bacterium]GIS37671.1 MAG: calcium/sodium antiporter [Actinomycetota bacterium]|tara:strand:- start:325 stop:1248 length:924 start_codon:yes stop_codon:yes gene_type:complete
METFLIFGGFVLGLILLVKGADEMVKSAIQIAVKFKLPNSVIGATFIGFGTSAPELFTSTGAAINGDLSLAIGNIIGSNIANSLLVLAVLYLFIDKDFSKKININQISPVWMMIFTTIFVSTYILTNQFPLVLGIVLLSLVIFVTYKMVNEEAIDEEELVSEEKKYIWFRGILAISITIFGSSLVVDNAIAIADLFNISSLIVGVTIIAIGTSLPEVAGAISAARLKKPDLIMGNVFGSNLFNIGLVGGSAIIFEPGEISSNIDYQMFLMYFVSFLAVLLTRYVIKRNVLVGIIFIAAYFGFIFSLF